MNLLFFFWIILSIGITLSVTNGQGCEVLRGSPSIVKRGLGKFSSAEKCGEACKSKAKCILWEFKKNTKECSIAKLKINDDKQANYGLNNCGSSPTNIPGLDNVLDEMRNMSKAIKDLKEQNENGFNNMNEKLTNVESQNEVLQLDFKEQTNLTMEKLDSTYNDLKNDSQVLHQQLTSLNEQTNFTKMEIQEKIDDKFDVAYNDHEMLKNESQVLGNELKSLIVDPATYCYGYFDSNTGTCYTYKVLTDVNRTWPDSRVECQRAGGDLAKIETNAEWQFVKKGILSGVDYHVFLGGTDVQQEDRWLWTDGSPVSFTDWLPGAPRNRTNYNCLAAAYGYSWQWFDEICEIYYREYYAVCKIKA